MPMIRRVSVYVILIVACLMSIVPFAITFLASLKTMPEIVQGVLTGWLPGVLILQGLLGGGGAPAS